MNWKNSSEKNMRNLMMDKLNSYIQKFPHNTNSGVKILPVVHGTKLESSAWGIFQTGFASLGWTDDGYFGKGLYFSPNVEYSATNYGNLPNGEYMMLVCWVALGNTYPVTENPFGPNNLMGKASMKGHDSHVSVVKPQLKDEGCKSYVPITNPSELNLPKTFTEIIVFGEGQVLPSYLVICKKKQFGEPIVKQFEEPIVNLSKLKINEYLVPVPKGTQFESETLKLLSKPYFRPLMSSEEADEILSSCSTGTFVVRFAMKEREGFVLSYNSEDSVRPSKVLFFPARGGGYQINKQGFTYGSVDQIIQGLVKQEILTKSP